MGAYGSPDTYPYDKIERKCPKCGKTVKGKFCPECGTPLKKKIILRDNKKSKFDAVLISVSIIINALVYFIGTNRSLNNLFCFAAAASSVCFLGFIIRIVICAISKKDNSGNIKKALISIVLSIILFILFGLTMN